MDNKCRDIALVISKVDDRNGLTITEDMLLTFLESNSVAIQYYAFILHTESEYHHYHLILRLDKARDYKKIVMEMARTWLCSEVVIQARPVYDMQKVNRYLVHIDNPEKALYTPQEVVTSNMKMYMDFFSGIDSDNLTIESIVALVQECNSITEIAMKVGAKNYKNYRWVIMDLWKEKNLVNN